MTDADRARYILCLRFPADLEQAYQKDYYERLRPALRIVFPILVFVLFLVCCREISPGFRTGLPSEEILEGFFGFLKLFGGILLALCALQAATFLPGFWRYWQVVYTVGIVGLCGWLLVQTGGGIDQKVGQWWSGLNLEARHSETVVLIPTFLKTYDFLRYPIGAMIIIATFRFPFRWTLFALSVTALVGLWSATVQMNVIDRAGTLERSIQAFLIPLILLSLTSLVQERLARETFLANYLLDIERGKSENLLLNILPDSIAHRLKETPGTIADNFAEVTVLFADIADFTPLSVAMPPDEVVSLLNEIFSEFDVLAEKHGLEKIKTIGDAYMAVAGLPEPKANHAQAAADMALEMQTVIAHFRRDTGEPLRLRIGLNSGPVVAGVIGIKKFIYDLWGDTVNTASRMESHGTVGSVQVTEDTYRLLQSGYTFGEGREMDIKGKGRMTVYTLQDSLH